MCTIIPFHFLPLLEPNKMFFLQCVRCFWWHASFASALYVSRPPFFVSSNASSDFFSPVLGIMLFPGFTLFLGQRMLLRRNAKHCHGMNMKKENKTLRQYTNLNNSHSDIHTDDVRWFYLSSYLNSANSKQKFFPSLFFAESVSG